MRVRLSELFGFQATTYEGGQELRALIEPAIARGEAVELDFEGVRFLSPLFCSQAFGVLIELDKQERVAGLFRFENLEPRPEDALDMALETAVRRRENPRWAAAMDAAFERMAEEN